MAQLLRSELTLNIPAGSDTSDRHRLHEARDYSGIDRPFGAVSQRKRSRKNLAFGPSSTAAYGRLQEEALVKDRSGISAC
ncbi:hypothetical protein AA103193_1624 [Tanticharoenia sakaeratensis NBRC 103193]|nr:hypothetical protein AA103193_1624 [Tanticharoenia sakaeratensis NBRC 103193]